MNEKSQRWLIRGAAVAIVAAAIGGAVWWKDLLQPAESDMIIEPWDALNGDPWLKADLDRARVILPDRPHTFSEVQQSRDGSSEMPIGRTRTYRLSTNSQRLRGPEFGPKGDGVTRIVAIGDSVTHGWGVTYEESYPAQLEAELERRGHDVEVINAGVPANQIPTMVRYCELQMPALEPDLVIWTRRPSAFDAPPSFTEYTGAVRRCAEATGARAIAVLPPISTFDLNGSRVWQIERDALVKELVNHRIPVVELTPFFRQAQTGRGEVLEQRDGKLVVVDQESGDVWLEARLTQRDPPPEVFELFEREPDVREALFFDSGHPDAEGFVVFAQAVADTAEQVITE